MGKPLRSAPATELPAGTLIQGTPYLALYNSSDAVFYLRGLYGNPYNIPLAGWSWTIGRQRRRIARLSSPSGRQSARTTYATLFALVGTTFGYG